MRCPWCRVELVDSGMLLDFSLRCFECRSEFSGDWTQEKLDEYAREHDGPPAFSRAGNVPDSGETASTLCAPTVGETGRSTTRGKA